MSVYQSKVWQSRNPYRRKYHPDSLWKTYLSESMIHSLVLAGNRVEKVKGGYLLNSTKPPLDIFIQLSEEAPA